MGCQSWERVPIGWRERELEHEAERTQARRTSLPVRMRGALLAELQEALVGEVLGGGQGERWPQFSAELFRLARLSK